MTVIIKKSSNEQTITLPAWLLSALKLQEGDLEPQLQTVSTHHDSLLTQLFLEMMSRLLNLLSVEKGTEMSQAKIEQKATGISDDDLNKFLALEGVLADDPDFDHAIESLNEAWQTWNPNFV